ncbi:hypothetical protein H257_11757 [Aphanomyces astaci]|uniref:Myosin motor domain-containing protein n=1 Tax=Aphanomyces astaci TaxID=112090 RepID=W4G3P6_APHAT|nr:hypothetical protein H257_11757 [Aphanomyces astaci]ETV73654.1 hypothetical protein H257_11757 [Aphanomyces astaci]|eukprot:XP_009837080.1 hypothetical protein H257_11757 [Aphanomyces astaci]
MALYRSSSSLRLSYPVHLGAEPVWIENPDFVIGSALPRYVKAHLVPPQSGVDSAPPHNVVYVQTTVNGATMNLELSRDRVWPREEDEPDNGVDNLVNLTHINNPCILHALYTRFMAKNMFTHVDNILLALNPWGMSKGQCDVTTQNYEPLRAMLKGALRKMTPAVAGGGTYHHSVLLLGDSGSGKSYIANAILHHLVEPSSPTKNHVNVTSVAMTEGITSPLSLGSKLLAAMTILDAFSNAATDANTESSRFGRVVKVGLDSQNALVAATIQCFQVESSRITGFHTLTKSGNTTAFHVLHLLHQTHRKQDEQFVEQHSNNNDTLGQLKTAMATLHLSPSVISSVFKLLEAIVLLTRLSTNDNERAVGEGIDDTRLELNQAEEWVGVPVGTLCDNFKPKSGASLLEVCRVLYIRVVGYVLKSINTVLEIDNQLTVKSIDIVDMPGFEALSSTHSFDSFCINYADEKLTQFFTQYIFKLEYRIYATEALTGVRRVPFYDNQRLVDLLDAKASSILQVLGEMSCDTASDTKTELVEKLTARFHHTQSPYFKPSSELPYSFVIQHTSADVEYSAADFYQAYHAATSLPCEWTRAFKLSIDPIIVAIVCPGDVTSKDFSQSQQQLQPPTTRSSRACADVERLLLSLCKSEPHFVQCIKTNTTKARHVFDYNVVQQQLQRHDILHTLLLRTDGYSYRATYAEFLDQYLCVEAFTHPRLMAMQPSDLVA